MDLGLVGRRALVCASSSGLGLACAAALARCKTMARREALCSDPMWASPATRPGHTRPVKRALSGADLF